ncbi:MAG: DNA-binding response regulator, partial [Rhizobiales bacterium 32-66-8]
MPDAQLIHVIDDDDAVRHSLAFLLESTGFRVRQHDSAAAFLAAGVPDKGGCIITDVRMPGLTGVELLHYLTTHGCRIPVIVVTGHADVPLAIEAIRAGVQDFIEKPFTDELLLD